MTAQNTTESARHATPSGAPDRLSLAVFVLILILTNVWFFTQALPHSH